MNDSINPEAIKSGSRRRDEYGDVENLAASIGKHGPRSGDVLRANNKRPKDQEPCFICSRYAAICHYHHAPALAKIGNIFAEWPEVLDNLSVYGVWLCPNHHYFWHALNSEAQPDLLPLLADFTMSEIAALTRLYRYEVGCWQKLEAIAQDQSELEQVERSYVRFANLACEEQREILGKRETYCAAIEQAMTDREFGPDQTVRELYAA